MGNRKVDSDTVHAFVKVTNRLADVREELTKLYKGKLSFANAGEIRNGHDLHDFLQKAMLELDHVDLRVGQCWEIVVAEWDKTVED